MREIEIKARVANMSQLIKKIDGQGHKLSAVVTQRDDVFTRGDKYGSADSVFVRVRKEIVAGKTRAIFTMKKIVKGHGDKIECETEVSDAEIMRRAIIEMGYEPFVTVAKSRRILHIDKYEICIDSVDDLGDFIEIEKLVGDDADHDAVVGESWDFAGKFGITRDNSVDKGYDVLVLEQTSTKKS